MPATAMVDPAEMTCPACGLVHAPPRGRASATLSCSHCRHPLAVRRGGARVALPWALAATALLAPLAWAPLVRVTKLGMERRIRLGEVGRSIREQGMAALGWFVDLCVVVAPALLLGGIVVLSLAVLTRRSFPGWHLGLRVVAWSRRWAMPEVLLLAFLVSSLKIGRLARPDFEPGFFALALGTVALLLAQQAFDPVQARAVLGDAGGKGRAHRGEESLSLQPAWAFLVAAAAMLVPANLLPIMEMSLGGKTTNNTIYGGTVALVREGMWGIAVIVFIASFLVPLVKLVGLLWLLLRARGARGTARCVRLHGWLDFIGRWSMLDILLLGVLCGLIQFGVLAHVRPGPGAPAFAMAVVLTVIAVERFPLRRLFHPTPRRAGGPVFHHGN